jgi:preprotein translocase subunit SecG
MSGLFATLLTILSIFLILLILVQRGRGGGLTGALGGMGGSSAFGAKAGDVFTRITIVTAAIWIAVCVAAAYWANPLHHSDRLGAAGGALPTSSAPVGTKPADSTGDKGAPTSDGAKSGSSESTAPPAGETTAPPATGGTAGSPTDSAPPAEKPSTEGK